MSTLNSPSDNGQRTVSRPDAIQSLLLRVDELRSALMATMPYVNGHRPETPAAMSQRTATLVKAQRALRNEVVVRDAKGWRHKRR